MGGAYRLLEKAELHLHLEGSLEPETLAELVPGLRPEEVAGRYRYADFDGFIAAYKWVTSFLQTPKAYGVAMRRLLERLEAENVRYAEVTLSAGVALVRGLDFGPLFEAVADAAAQSRIEVCFILDAIRQLGPDHARQVARLAVERASEGVVAFGIGGIEALGPAEWFAGVFGFVKEHGLHVTVHAGETAGPESVWSALHAGAERIGHGLRAAEDPALVAYLAEHDIPLEVCLSSNLALRLVASLKTHPARRLFEAGVPLTLNTDDPAMFHTTLAREYELAERELGFRPEELSRVAANGFRYSFRGPRFAAP